jgi:hypothetical protein
MTGFFVGVLVGVAVAKFGPALYAKLRARIG